MTRRRARRIERAVWGALRWLLGAFVLGGMFWGYVIYLVFNGGQS